MSGARKGWCPSLSAPMATGDGLLARLSPRLGLLSPAQLAGIAEAARRHGSGQIEITIRGNMQIRGLTQQSASMLADAVAALAIEAEPAPEIRVSPTAALSGDDALIAMAADVRDSLAAAGVTGRLAPKFAITIDDDRQPTLSRLSADVRLCRLAAGQWLVAAAGDARTATVLGQGDRQAALAAVIALGRTIADFKPDARARDLSLHALQTAAHGLSPSATAPDEAYGLIGRFTLKSGASAFGVALPFGQTEADSLAAFARALGRHAAICLAPGHGMLIASFGDTGVADIAVASAASDAGMISDSDDPRLRIQACAGAPACGSGYLETRALAREMADSDMPAGMSFYVAGCAKQCARPATPHLAVVGGESGASIQGVETIVSDPYRRYLRGLARRFAVSRSLSA